MNGERVNILTGHRQDRGAQGCDHNKVRIKHIKVSSKQHEENYYLAENMMND